MLSCRAYWLQHPRRISAPPIARRLVANRSDNTSAPGTNHPKKKGRSFEPALLTPLQKQSVIVLGGRIHCVTQTFVVVGTRRRGRAGCRLGKTPSVLGVRDARCSRAMAAIVIAGAAVMVAAQAMITSGLGLKNYARTKATFADAALRLQLPFCQAHKEFTDNCTMPV